MYLVIIHVPAYMKGNQAYLSTDWNRSLNLLKESLNDRFGELVVLCPAVPYGDEQAEQNLEKTDIRVIPSIDPRGRALDYWRHKRQQWLKDVKHWVGQADVVHAGMDQVWKPIMFEGFVEGVTQKKTTLFVGDMDIASQLIELSKNAGLSTRMKNFVVSKILEQAIRWAVGKADLSLLKGKQLMNRYARFAKNAKEFHDTSYFNKDVITKDDLNQRLERLKNKSQLNLVYAGRFEWRKGLHKSLEFLANADSSIYLDLIGSGTEKSALEREVERLGLSKRVRFLGTMDYGIPFFKKLSEYDGLLFTPVAEDTPRMIFDGFAAGLPLISTPIPYTEEVINHSGAGQLFETSDDLTKIAKNRDNLVKFSNLAREEALKQSADYWYAKRTQWTIEAYDKHQLKG